MANQTYPYHPDYAVPPGWVLEEHIQALGLSPEEFARRCGHSPEYIADVIRGAGAIEAQAATAFERETGLHKTIWLNMEASYRNKLAELKQDGAGDTMEP